MANKQLPVPRVEYRVSPKLDALAVEEVYSHFFEQIVQERQQKKCKTQTTPKIRSDVIINYNRLYE